MQSEIKPTPLSRDKISQIQKKFSRDSNTRMWEGRPASIIRFLAAAFSVYCIWVTLFSTAMPEVRLNIFISLVIVLGYLRYPIIHEMADEPVGNATPPRFRISFALELKGRINSIPWFDIILMLCGAIPLWYFAWNAESIIRLALKVTSPRNPDYLLMITMAVLVLLSLVELCRRCVGIPILCVVGALLVYAFSTVRFGKVIYDLYYSTGEGLRSAPIEVCARYIVLFIIFGAFLERTGISAVFIEIANRIAGASAGGPAKVAVISSGLCGMVSGSSVGNTVTTGSITIPMMKKAGYQAEFAGAVEATASTGGQIMPPIMGAAAFLLAEYMGLPYIQVAMVAILPSVLYFSGVYIAVHLEAKRLGLKGTPRSERQNMKPLLPQLYMLLPLIVLIALVSSNTYTMQFSAAISILLAVLVGFFNPSNRLTVRKMIDALASGGQGTITVAVACAMAGLVAGCITATGLASEIITVVVGISDGHTLIALILTMICCIVLGMGVPTTANYCIMAAVCAPILISPQIGLPMMCAHFFVFYFGIIADITPPVALAAYAGSAIAGAPPMKTALNATRLAIAAFIVPYILAFEPQLLFIDMQPLFVVEGAKPWLNTVLIIAHGAVMVVTALFGIFAVAAALNGFLYRPISWLRRGLLIVAGLCMLYPGVVTDAVGLGLLLLVLAHQRVVRPIQPEQGPDEGWINDIPAREEADAGVVAPKAPETGTAEAVARSR